MEIVVTYDVATEKPAGRKRLRHVAQICLNYGQRVQKSVFECSVDRMQYERMRSSLLKSINEKEDSLRIYRLLEPKKEYLEHFGCGASIDFDDPLVV